MCFDVFLFIGVLNRRKNKQKQINMKLLSREEREIDFNEAYSYAYKFILCSIIVVSIPFYIIWKGNMSFCFFTTDLNLSGVPLLVLCLSFILVTFTFGLFLHEIIHGIVWSIFSKKGTKAVFFGFFNEPFTPYCSCEAPLSIKLYILGALAPALLLGGTSLVVAYITGNVFCLLYCLLFMTTATGDFFIVSLLIKEKGSIILVADQPRGSGYYIYK